MTNRKARKSMRRVLAILLTLTLCVGLLPVGVWAADLDGTSLIPVDGTLVTAATWTTGDSNLWTITSGTAKSASIKSRNSSSMTLTLTVAKDVQLSYTATEKKNGTLYLTLDSGTEEQVVTGATSANPEINLTAGEHTLVWRHYVTGTTNRQATMNGFGVVDANSLRTVTVETAGTDDTVDLTGAAATVNNGSSATVVSGETVTLKAVDGNAAIFEGWYAGETKISGNSTFTYTVTDPMTITAKFQSKAAYTLTLGIEGNGTIKVDGAEVSNDGTINVYGGTQYTLAVTVANADYTVFDGWYANGERVSTAASYKYTPNGSATLTAKIVPKTMAGIPGWVTAVGTTSTYPWTGSADGTLSSATLTTNKTTSTLYLKFTATETSVLAFDYEVSARNTNGLSLTLNNGSEDIRTEMYKGSNTSNSGTAVVTGDDAWEVPAGEYTLTASYNRTAAAKSNWVKLKNIALAGADSTATLTVKTEGDQGFGAANATVKRNGAAWLKDTDTEQTLTSIPGRAVTLSAAPDADYLFGGWFRGDTLVSAEAELSYTFDTTETIVAKFYKKAQYTITLNYNATYGTVAQGATSATATNAVANGGSFSVSEGNTIYIQVTETGTDDMAFVGWKNAAGEYVYTGSPAAVTVTGDLTLTGSFASGFDAVMGGISYTNDATYPWRYAGEVNGQRVVRSGNDGHGSSYSTLTLNINVPSGQAKVLEFKFAGSSEAIGTDTSTYPWGNLYDYLEILLDDELVLSKNRSWDDMKVGSLGGLKKNSTEYATSLSDLTFTAYSVGIPAGSHKVQFRFSEDSGTFCGLDGGFITGLKLTDAPSYTLSLTYDESAVDIQYNGESLNGAKTAKIFKDVPYTLTAYTKQGFSWDGWYLNGSTLQNQGHYIYSSTATAAVKLTAKTSAFNPAVAVTEGADKVTFVNDEDGYPWKLAGTVNGQSVISSGNQVPAAEAIIPSFSYLTLNVTVPTGATAIMTYDYAVCVNGPQFSYVIVDNPNAKPTGSDGDFTASDSIIKLTDAGGNASKTVSTFTYSTNSINLTGGTHTVRFVYVNTSTSTNSRALYLKNIQISSETPTATATLSYNNGYGSVTLNGAAQEPGSITQDLGLACTYRAAAKEGYLFDGWYSGSALMTRDPEYSLKVGENYALEARFTDPSSLLPSGVKASMGSEGYSFYVSGNDLVAGNNSSNTDSYATLVLKVPAGVKTLTMDVKNRGMMRGPALGWDDEPLTSYGNANTRISAPGATPNGAWIYGNKADYQTQTFVFHDTTKENTVTVRYKQTSGSEAETCQALVRNIQVSNTAPEGFTGTEVLGRVLLGGSESGVAVTANSATGGWYWDSARNAIASGSRDAGTTSKLTVNVEAGWQGIYWEELYSAWNTVDFEVWVDGSKAYTRNSEDGFADTFARQGVKFSDTTKTHTVEFRAVNKADNEYGSARYQTFWLKNITAKKVALPKTAVVIGAKDGAATGTLRLSSDGQVFRVAAADSATAYTLALKNDGDYDSMSVKVDGKSAAVTGEQELYTDNWDNTAPVGTVTDKPRVVELTFVKDGWMSGIYTFYLSPGSSAQAKTDWPTVDSVDPVMNPNYWWSRNESFHGSLAYVPNNQGQQSTEARMAVTVNGVGTLSFNYYADSEGSDKLRVLDEQGKTLGEYSGENNGAGWKSATLQITGDANAKHTLTFVYAKDYSIDRGEDLVAVSGVAFTAQSAQLTIGYTGGSEAYGAVTAAGFQVGSNDVGVGSIITLTAAPKSGGRFYGWYDAASGGNLLSFETNYTHVVGNENDVVYACFAAADTYQAYRGGTLYPTLKDAFGASATGNLVILAQDATVTESLTIPAGVMLLVPSSGADAGYSETGYNYNNEAFYANGNYRGKTLYRTLTVAEGATLTVNGKLLVNSVSGRPAAGHYDQDITGGYGQIVLNGEIVVGSGGMLDNYGYVTGSGSVTAQSGGTVSDLYVVKNWRGGTQAYAMYNNSVYPMNEYELHNIQVPVTIRSGATYTGFVKMFASGSYYQTRFPQVDNANGLIRLTEGAIAVKSYQNGRETYTLTGGGRFVSSALNIVGMNMSTAENNFIYPINGIYDYVLNDGAYSFAESYKFMPGATMTVNDDAALSIESGKTVVFYDSFHTADPANTDNTQYPASRGAATLTLKGDSSLTNNGTFAGTMTTENADGITGMSWSATTKEANGYNNGTRSLTFGLTLNGETGTGSNWSYDADKNIVFSKADYTAVNAAIDAAKAKAGENLNQPGYTDATLTALQTAVNAVQEGLLLGQQSTVDAWAAAITEATAALAGNTYNVTCSDPDGTTVTPESFTVTYGKRYGESAELTDGELPVPTRPGYTFDYWKDESGKQITKDDAYLTAGDTVLTAVWADAIGYTISLYPEGGELANSAFLEQSDGSFKMTFTVEYDAITLPTPEKTGYTFLGWTGSNGSTPQKAVEISKGSTGSKTYTANWQINSHTVSWMLTDDVEYRMQRQDYGTAVVAPENDPAREGYVFKGWASYPETMPDADVKIAAQWDSYLELLNDLAISDETLAQARSYYAKLNADQRENYDPAALFAAINSHETAQTEAAAAAAVPGINSGALKDIAALELKEKNADGRNVLYVELTNMDKPAKDMLNNEFLKALFNYDGVGTIRIGDSDPISKTAQFSIMLEIAWQTIAEENGYSEKAAFENWLREQQETMTVGILAGTGVAADLLGTTDEGVNISVPYMIYFFEQGKQPNAAAFVTLSFDSDGGSAVDSIVKRPGTLISPPADPQKTGYTFGGWTKADGTPFAFTDVTVMPTEGLALKAVWTANEYEISFDANGGAGTAEPITVTYDSAYGTLPTVSKTGYTCDGWYLENEKITAASVVKVVRNTTLKAQWTANTYTLTLAPDGGTVDSSTVEAVYDSVYTLPTPEKAGYTFAGWYLDGGEGAQLVTGDVVSMTRNVTLTAKWQAMGSIPYNVRHYKQDLDGDTYTLADTELLTGATDSEVYGQIKPYTGFTLRDNSVTKGVVKGDGSLTIDLYYDRDVHTVTWNVNGTQIEEPYRYGAMPRAPENTGKADDNNGSYAFTGWDKTVAEVTEDVTYTAQYDKTYDAVIGNTTYRTLAVALENAAEGQRVVLARDAALSEDTTVPAGVTLLVPCKDNDIGYQNGRNYDNPGTSRAAELYRTLTVPEGVTLTVNGTLLVNAVTGIAAAGHYDQEVTGGYGKIALNGSIAVNGVLDCFGYITGMGTVIARQGSEVGDLYVVRNWRGGSQALEMYVKEVYPMNEYDCHNIETPIRIEPGASYVGLVKMYASGSYYFTRFPQINNTNGLIRLTGDGAYVLRTYNSASQRELYTISGSADFSRSTLNIVGMDLSTGDYIFPIDGDIGFQLNGGSYRFTEDYKFLPGASVTVGNDASLEVLEGKTVVFYHEFKDPDNTDGTQYSADRAAAVLNLGQGGSFANLGTFAGDITCGDGNTNITSAAASGWTAQTQEANGYYAAQSESSQYTVTLNHVLRINGETEAEAEAAHWYIDGNDGFGTLAWGAHPTHVHNWSYTASGASITAACTADGHEGGTATITIGKPALATYGGEGSADAILTGGISGVDTPSVVYQSGARALDAAPTDAGTYTASITLGSATASVTYTIGKAASSVTSAPTAKSLTYTGQAQALVTAGTATGGTTQYCIGTNSTTTPALGYSTLIPTGTDAGTYSVWYKAAGDGNHSDSEAACVTVTIRKADQNVPATPSASSVSATSITLTPITNGEYSMDATAWQASPTFTGLTASTSYTFYQRSAADGNHNVSSTSTGANISTSNHVHNWSYTASGATITATCSAEGHTGGSGSMTIVAPTRTIYGGTGSEAATVSGGINGVDVPSIVYRRGSTTLNAAPTDAGTYTASITLGSATASVTYTIAKATPVVTAPKRIDNLVASESAHDLITAGSTTGGTMQYRLGDGVYSTAIPTASAAGAYTVYYRVAGDSNYDAVAEKSFTVPITAVAVSVDTVQGATEVSVTAQSGTIDSGMTETLKTVAGSSKVKGIEEQGADAAKAAAATGLDSTKKSELGYAPDEDVQLEAEVKVEVEVKSALSDTGAAAAAGSGVTSLSLDITPKVTVVAKGKGDNHDIPLVTDQTITDLTETVEVVVSLSGLGFSPKLARLLHNGVISYVPVIDVGGGNYSWQQRQFSEVTLLTDERYGDITFLTQNGESVIATMSYGVSELNQAFGVDAPKISGSTFAGWKFSDGTGADTTMTNELLEKLNGSNHKLTLTAAYKADEADNGGGHANGEVPSGGSTGGGGGGGGAAVPNNAAVTSASNGKAAISPTSPKAGDKVTVTATPNSGYKAASVTVKDKNGNAIAVTDNGDGTYSFTMPTDSKLLPVTVTPTFEKKNDEQPNTGKFIDVPTTAYYADAVAWAVEKGITNGAGENIFSPEASCTRAQMVTFLWRAAGSPEPTNQTNPFVDIGGSDSYYFKAVLWAVEQNITNGIGIGTFSPNDTVTRAQVVTFLYRFEKANAGTDSGFADVEKDAWYAEAVTWAVDHKITNGTGNNQFSPNSNCTRGQIVTFLYRDMAE